MTCPSVVVEVFLRSRNVGKWSCWCGILDLVRPIVIVLTFAEVDVIYSIL